MKIHQIKYTICDGAFVPEQTLQFSKNNLEIIGVSGNGVWDDRFNKYVRTKALYIGYNGKVYGVEGWTVDEFMAMLQGDCCVPPVTDDCDCGIIAEAVS